MCAFETYDRDHDGVVGVHDLVSTLEETTHGAMSLTRRTRMAEGLVRRFDANGDGGLEMNEFLNLLNAEDYLGGFTVEMYAFDGASPASEAEENVPVTERATPLAKFFSKTFRFVRRKTSLLVAILVTRPPAPSPHGALHVRRQRERRRQPKGHQRANPVDENRPSAPKSLALSPASAKSNHVPSATLYHPNATGNAMAQNPSSTMTYAIVPALPKDLTLSMLRPERNEEPGEPVGAAKNDGAPNRGWRGDDSERLSVRRLEEESPAEQLSVLDTRGADRRPRRELEHGRGVRLGRPIERRGYPRGYYYPVRLVRLRLVRLHRLALFDDGPRRDPARAVTEQRQQRLQRHQRVDAGRVVEEVEGARAETRGEKRRHRDGHVSPIFIPRNVGISVNQSHRDGPLRHGRHVHRPRGHRQRVRRLVKRGAEPGGLRAERQRERPGSRRADEQRESGGRRHPPLQQSLHHRRHRPTRLR